MIDLYNKYGWKSEKKGAEASQNQKLEFATALNQMLASCPQIKIDCIVVKKENVQAHIRQDPNKLYNYMCKLVVVDHVDGTDRIEFVPDKRSIKVESGNSLSDYLQTVLWFDCNSKARLINNPKESHKCYSLQVVDWIANSVWSHYEDGETTVFNQIRQRMKIRPLFF